MLYKIIILVGLVLVIVYVNNTHNTHTDSFTNITTSGAVNTKTLTPLEYVIDTGYNKLNLKRFDTIDNQIKLDQLNKRVANLMQKIQKSYINNSSKSSKSSSTPITFY